jgi:chromosome segregation ATPase
MSDQPTDITALATSEANGMQPLVEYKAMRNSHASLMRSRGQLLRRSRELSEARDRFLTTLRSYEERLMLIGQEKAEALRLAQDMHQELEAFDSKQQALDKLLQDLDEAKQEAGFWSVFQINALIDRMRTLLRGGGRSNG